MPRFVRFREDGHPFFITTVVQGRRPIFEDALSARLMLDVLQETGRRYRFEVLAFAVMPDHLHVLVVPRVGDTAAQVVRFIKGTFARRWNIERERKGTVWQAGFYERMIRDERSLAEVIAYIEMNPVVAGLAERPEDWPFGSASDPAAWDLEHT